MLDHLDASGRFALLKLATGGLRVGINARLAKQAFADAFGLEVEAVEEVWHGIDPPFAELFDWAEGRAAQPTARDVPIFRPFMLAHPLEATKLSLDDYAAEWKWDGIRVQLVHAGGQTRLYSRTGDDISHSFPDVAEAFGTIGVLDGELLVRGSDQGVADVHGGAAASFNALQQRLGRKNVSPKTIGSYPAFVRLYDILFEGESTCASCLGANAANGSSALREKLDPERFDVSQLIEARSFEELEDLRLNARDASIEGIMLKRRESAYVARSPNRTLVQVETGSADRRLRADVRRKGLGQTLQLLQRLYVWRWNEEGELLPVGKAYFGFTDEELKWLDRWIRGHTVQRFGPVREVEKSLVLEVAFDSIHKSTRHKSGVAMRFPRISRIRIDKPAAEADRLASLQSMVT